MSKKDEIILTDKDHEILDRVWDKIKGKKKKSSLELIASDLAILESRLKLSFGNTFQDFMKEMTDKKVRTRNPDTGNQVAISTLSKTFRGSQIVQKMFDSWKKDLHKEPTESKPQESKPEVKTPAEKPKPTSDGPKKIKLNVGSKELHSKACKHLFGKDMTKEELADVLGIDIKDADIKLKIIHRNI